MTLTIWLFLGLFIRFPFPYGQAFDLIVSCFKGTLASNLNRLQRRWHSENIDTQSPEKLNNLEFQARLYLGVLEKLGSNKVKSRERLAQAIEALKYRKNKIDNELKTHQIQEYKTVVKAQDFFESILSDKSKKDLLQIEETLDELILFVKCHEPAGTMSEDLINGLSREIAKRILNITPSGMGTLYKLGTLLREISEKDISKLNDSELDELNSKIINNLKGQKEILEHEISRLNNESESAQKQLKKYSEDLYKSNNIIAQLESQLSRAKEKLKLYSESNQNKQNRINDLDSELDSLNVRYLKLQFQKNTLNERVNQLNNNIQQKQEEISQLQHSLKKYSEIRTLEGQYIGNIDDSNAKYHFNEKCNHRKMLVGEYVLKLDLSREIVSSTTPDIFIENGMEACDKCSEKSQGRRH